MYTVVRNVALLQTVTRISQTVCSAKWRIYFCKISCMQVYIYIHIYICVCVYVCVYTYILLYTGI
jgi:hypothetical protein